MSTVLVTGGAGFIGCHVCDLLLEKGKTVRVLDALSPQVHSGGEPSDHFKKILPHIEFIHGDIQDEEMVRRAIDGVEDVIHLVAETGTGQSMYEIRRYVGVNEYGTALLLEELAKSDTVKGVVVASSRAVYGEGKYRCQDHGIVFPGERRSGDLDCGKFELYCPTCSKELTPLPTDETVPVNPGSVYGLTKYGQEVLTLQFGKTTGKHAVALRYQNVYGPGQSLSNPYTGILAIFSTRFRLGKDVLIFEDGKESRDFVFVEDVARATVDALGACDTAGEVINIGSGSSVSVLEVARQLRQHINPQAEMRVTGQYRVGDIRHNFADLEKARTTLGFKPVVDFNAGLRCFVDWVLTMEQGEDKFQQSLEELRAKGLFK